MESIKERSIIDEKFIENVAYIYKLVEEYLIEFENKFTNFNNILHSFIIQLSDIIENNIFISENDKSSLYLLFLIVENKLKNKFLEEYFTNRYESEFITKFSEKLYELIVEEFEYRKDEIPQIETL